MVVLWVWDSGVAGSSPVLPTKNMLKEVRKSMKGLDLPKNFTKFLVFNDNPKYLRYVFGENGIYVESVTSIAGKSAHGALQRPAIVVVRYDTDKQIRLHTTRLEQLQPRRIFKSVWKRPETRNKIDAFIFNCAKNLLNLAKGKTLRIVCKDDSKLQQRCYDAFVKVNEEDKLYCTFDYDEYDVVFRIQEYVDAKDKHWFITSVTGLD